MFCNYVTQPCFSDFACANLRKQIALSFLRSAHVVKKEIKYVADHGPSADDPDRRNAYAFLIDFTARPHRSWIISTHISVMCARRNIKHWLVFTLCKHWQNHGYVGKMSAASVRIIENRHITASK